MIALAIDASTYRGTVAVFRDRTVVASSEAAMRGAHAEALMPAVAAALEAAGIVPATIDRVICGEGPGSFTSLRIAAAIAKGIALGADAALHAVSSLALTLASATVPAGRYVVTLDALRDEWYVAIYEQSDNGAIVETQPMVRVAKQDLDVFAATHHATILGAARGNAEPHAVGCLALMDNIEAAGPVDLERWEPAYGRLAEAQVKWEAAHGRALGA